MKAIRLNIELEYDDAVMHGNDQTAIDWFYEEVLGGSNGLLILHSNEIGDTVGKVTVLEIDDK